jgi:hypothetical protein
MPHRLIGIDQVILGAAELDTASAAWSRLGFTLGPRATDAARGTAACRASFAMGAVELLDAGAAGSAIGWASRDLDESARSLRAAGLAAGPIEEIARQIELPEATIVERSRRLSLALPGVPGFVTAADDSALLRRAPWLDHPNGALALIGLTLVAEEPLALGAAYERLLGAAAMTLTDDVVTFPLGRQRLIIATADDLMLLHPELDADATPGIALVTLATADLERSADHLAQWQIDFDQSGRHGLMIPPEAAGGTALEFVPAG